jgi:uncharacterized protein
VSATDADSEGVEGRYFVWSYDEVVEVVRGVDADPERWTAFLGVTPAGNWEGTNVLHEPVDRRTFADQHGLAFDDLEDRWERVRLALLERRAGRIPPGVDDKVLTSWNALAIRGLVRAGMLLDEPAWLTAATAAATFLHDHLVDADGTLHHVWHRGRLGSAAFLEDVAALALADLELFGATGETVWLDRAIALAEDADARFRDEDEGGWFQTAHEAEPLFTRPKETWDNATPAGTSVMVEVCLGLAGVTGDHRWRDRAEEGRPAPAGGRSADADGVRVAAPPAGGARRRSPRGRHRRTAGWRARRVATGGSGTATARHAGRGGRARSRHGRAAAARTRRGRRLARRLRLPRPRLRTAGHRPEDLGRML